MVQKNSQKLAVIAATWTAGLTGEFLLLAQDFLVKGMEVIHRINDDLSLLESMT
jgi:hypothetical protein